MEMAVDAAPSSGEELADVLRDAAERKQIIELGGHFTKRDMGGKIARPDIVPSTRELKRVLAYEPNDLTISVEAGLPYSELRDTLHSRGQFLPLDPPFDGNATIGGVIAANNSGPRRRRYGTARDMVIGMTFATLAGKLVRSGGMVVKNVTGLDMAKIMVGSFGTLAAIVSVNFKVFPRPAEERTFLATSESLAPLLFLRTVILRSKLQPVAIDLLDPGAATLASLPDAHYCLSLEAGGNGALVDRHEREWGALAKENGAADFRTLDQSDAASFWSKVREFPALAAAGSPDGIGSAHLFRTEEPWRCAQHRQIDGNLRRTRPRRRLRRLRSLPRPRLRPALPQRLPLAGFSSHRRVLPARPERSSRTVAASRLATRRDATHQRPIRPPPPAQPRPPVQPNLSAVRQGGNNP